MTKSIVPVVAAAILVTANLYAAEDLTKERPVTPKKVAVDTNYDGKIDRTEVYNSAGQVARVEIDNDADGAFDETIIYENGKPMRREKDTNNDKKADVWMEY